LNAKIIGASFDTSADNQTFATNEQFGFRLLSDVDRAVGRAYGVARGPDEQYPDFPKRMTFLINPEGRIAKIYDVADPGAHPQLVLEDLRQIATSA